MIIGFFVGMCFGTFVTIFIMSLLVADRPSEQDLEMVGDDAYADGYEQRIQDERAGIQRLPTHRP